MSILYILKPQKDRALRPVSLALGKAGVTPDMVTACGLFLSVAAGLLALTGYLYAGIVVFLAGACLDAVDGSLARACGRCTEFGRYFDSVCDRLSELAFVAGAVAGGAPAAAFLVIVGSYVLLLARIYNHRKGLDSNAATFGRPGRLALLVAGLLVPEPCGTVLFAIAGLLGVVSALQVILSGLRRSETSEGIYDEG